MKHSNFRITNDIIGLDLGMSRTGVARINTIANIPEPLPIIDMKQGNLVADVAAIVQHNNACCVVAGVPRGLDSQLTEQTRWAMDVVKELETSLDIPVFSTDEAGTTVQARSHARPGQSVDSVAAGIILSDFLAEVEADRIDNVSI